MLLGMASSGEKKDIELGYAEVETTMSERGGRGGSTRTKSVCGPCANGRHRECEGGLTCQCDHQEKKRYQEQG
jgi:hypothetical protein